MHCYIIVDKYNQLTRVGYHAIKVHLSLKLIMINKNDTRKLANCQMSEPNVLTGWTRAMTCRVTT